MAERKGQPRTGSPARPPGSLANNLKGAGLSSGLSYENTVVEGKGGEGRSLFILWKRVRFFFFFPPVTKCRLGNNLKSLQCAKLLHLLPAGAGGPLQRLVGAGSWTCWRDPTADLAKAFYSRQAPCLLREPRPGSVSRLVLLFPVQLSCPLALCWGSGTSCDFWALEGKNR